MSLLTSLLLADSVEKAGPSDESRDDHGRWSGSAGSAQNPRVFRTHDDVSEVNSWGEKFLVWKDRPGLRVTGQRVHKSSLPASLYHVTTAADKVASSGVLIGQKKDAGLGGGQEDGVSFTTDENTARVIQRELRRAVAIAKGHNDIGSLERYAREDEEEAGIPHGSLNGAVNSAQLRYDVNAKSPVYAEDPSKLLSLTHDAFNSYLMSRDLQSKHPLLKNPILFSNKEALKTMDPEQIRVLVVPSANIPAKALITTGSDVFLHEVRAYSDVPVHGMSIQKYSPDEPRDSGGKWTGGTVHVYHGGTMDSAVIPAVTYWTKDRAIADSYTQMSADRFEGPQVVHEKDLTLKNPAPEAVVMREAKNAGIDNEHYSPDSVFDASLHGEENVRNLVDVLSKQGYDGAVLECIGYGTNKEGLAYIEFNQVVEKDSPGLSDVHVDRPMGSDEPPKEDDEDDECAIDKGAEDEPRDDRGRWTKGFIDSKTGKYLTTPEKLHHYEHAQEMGHKNLPRAIKAGLIRHVSAYKEQYGKTEHNYEYVGSKDADQIVIDHLIAAKPTANDEVFVDRYATNPRVIREDGLFPALNPKAEDISGSPREVLAVLRQKAEGAKKSRTKKSDDVQYVPPVEVHRAAKSAWDAGTAVIGITEPLSEGSGIPASCIQEIAKHFETSESATETETAKNAWGGKYANKWALRVLRKIEKTEGDPDEDEVDKGGPGSGPHVGFMRRTGKIIGFKPGEEHEHDVIAQRLGYTDTVGAIHKGGLIRFWIGDTPINTGDRGYEYKDHPDATKAVLRHMQDADPNATVYVDLHHATAPYPTIRALEGSPAKIRLELNKLNKSDTEDVEKVGSGVLISFWLDPDTAAQLKVPDGENTEDMHMTLLYLGKDVPEEKIPELENALASFAQRYAPVDGQIAGPIRFPATESSEGRDVCVASFENPGIQEFREALREAVEAAGIEVR